jgi:hypothetical protein
MSLDAQPITAPYGTWKSPLDAEAVYRKSGVAVTDVLVDKVTGDVFHIEVSGFVYASFITSLAYHTLAFVGLFQSRPDEGGRFVLMRTLAGKGGDQRKEHVPLSIVPSSSSVRRKSTSTEVVLVEFTASLHIGANSVMAVYTVG